MYGEEGCDLAGMVAAADASNHSILMEEEVSQGVGRLVASGLVTLDDNHFGLTDAGRAIADKCQGGLIGQVRSMHSLLGRQRLTDGIWPVPAGAVDAAFSTYKAGIASGG